MKKIEALKKLREVVLEQRVNLAHGEYYNENSKQCCVVGHLLRANGATTEQLVSLDMDLYGSADYTISSIMTTARKGKIEPDKDFVTPILTNLGFDMGEDEGLFERLQKANDNSDGSQSQVIHAIDLEIEKLEAAQ